MHLPDGFISPQLSLPAYAVAVPLWAWGARRHFGREAAESLPVLGSLAALAFVVQTILIPVPGGTSIHLTGVTLLALLFGPLAAFVCESLVLVIQALFFGAGGVTVLGVNALAMGLIGPLAGDAWRKLKERLILKRSFSGSVSPVVMNEILSGQLSPGLGGERKYVCVLFADIRGFTTLSESLSPEAVITLLNRYFDRVVDQIHHQDGAVVCFMGDGIMAIFGAPKRLPNPCEAALAAAKGMQSEVVKLNEILVREGAAAIQIGVGLHAGDAVIGQVGSSGRHDYTAIGDVTNVASRLEGLTKDVGFQIVCSKDVFEGLASNSDLTSVGPQAIKGHTPVHAYGWGPR